MSGDLWKYEKSTFQQLEWINLDEINMNFIKEINELRSRANTLSSFHSSWFSFEVDSGLFGVASNFLTQNNNKCYNRVSLFIN